MPLPFAPSPAPDLPWLTIIGVGEDGLDGLVPAARALVEIAEVVVGSPRHLAMVPPGPAERLAWTQPVSDSRAALTACRGRRVVLLTSGDPMWFGAVAPLTRWFNPSEMTVLPHPGAFSLAAARLLWPVEEVLCLTVHGRGVEPLALDFAPGRRLLILSEGVATPAAVADLLDRRGYGASRLWVLENLGSPDERIGPGPARSDLNLVAVECRVAPGMRPLSRTPGLPDSAFLHDGGLTPREVRAVTLAALAPLPGEVLWDIGAGAGSVAIEWCRAQGRALAIEVRPDRADRIARNALALGVPGLKVIVARAPDGLPLTGRPPEAIVVGGQAAAAPGLLDICRAALVPGGRLVANAASTEAEAALIAFHAQHGGEMTRIEVSRLIFDGEVHSWHPVGPVTQYVGWKR